MHVTGAHGGQNANVGMLPPSDSEDESEEEAAPPPRKAVQVNNWVHYMINNDNDNNHNNSSSNDRTYGNHTNNQIGSPAKSDFLSNVPMTEVKTA